MVLPSYTFPTILISPAPLHHTIQLNNGIRTVFLYVLQLEIIYLFKSDVMPDSLIKSILNAM